MTVKRMAVSISLVVSAWLTIGASDARAQNGSWSWGPRGFSALMTPAERETYLVTNGLADPNVNYWTPFWQSGHEANVYTGRPDTGDRNTFAINHDINANFGIPIVGYLDVFTPLFGTNELAISATISSVWNGIVDAVTSTWNFVTSLFSRDYTSYVDTGDYGGGGGWDNGYVDSFAGFGGDDCDHIVADVAGAQPNTWIPIDPCD